MSRGDQPVVMEAPGSEGAVKSKQVGILVASGFVGTALESFDFNVYSLLTASVFNRLFFPQLSPAVATIASFSVFAVGFLSRPLGGLVFGHYGDRIGRKPTMVITLCLMGFSTAAMGLVPPYVSIGVWAPIILTALRFLQGVAYGGESTASPLLVAESTPDRRRGFLSAAAYGGILGGVLMASAIVSLISHMSPTSLLAWGWRVPFLLSIFGVIVGLYFRLRIDESGSFLARIAKDQPLPAPLMEVFRSYRKPTIIVTLISIGMAAIYYFFAVFGISYAVHTMHAPLSQLVEGIMVGNIAAVFLMPLFGYLSDLLGRRPIIALCFVSNALFAIFGFFRLLHAGGEASLLLATAIPALLTPLAFGPSAALISELFDDPRVRFSGSAFGRQIGSVLGGGLLPLISASIIAATNNGTTYVVIIFTAVCLVSAVAAYCTPETKGVSI